MGLRCHRAGAHGYLLKNTPREELVKSIYDAMRQQDARGHGVAGKLFSQVKGKRHGIRQFAVGRTEPSRERDVLRLIGKGRNNSEIASTLHLRRNGENLGQPHPVQTACG